MVVQHNLTAMNSNRMLGLTTASQAKSTEKLSSGYKINRAADDAAGLSISEKMRKQIRGLTQASLNAQDGISAVQTAEGALTEVHDMLQRMNELAVKASNGTNSEDDRNYIQDEIDQLVTEIDRVAETTKFNETYLLKGDNTKTSSVYSYNGTQAMVTDMDGNELTNLMDVCGNNLSASAAKSMIEKGEKVYKTATNATAATADAASDTEYKKLTGSLYDANGHEVYKKGDILKTDVSTAKLYTDCGILTCDPQIGEDATAVFNMLSGYSEPRAWNKLSVAPLWLRHRFLRMINRETEHARAGREAHIMAKMNSLCDKEIISALYDASCAGVKIELIVRGICCLKAGVPGLSENISVRSIVGNFLEHSRIFYFFNDASPEVYMGSADWMPRNLDRRVEILFPVEDENLKEKVIHILKLELEDNVKAHLLQPDGSYEKVDKRGKVLVNSQDQFCEEAIEMAKACQESKDPAVTRIFQPIESSNE